MRARIKLTLLSILFLSQTSFATSLDKKEERCFPETNIQIPVQVSNFFESEIPTGLSKSEFNEVVAKFHNFWNPILQTKYDKKLFFQNKWEEARIDASATRDDDNNLIIKVFGGLARHPEMTKNAMLMILCHELGHYLGGAPKPFRGKSKKRQWSSAEGQADYFATSKCLPKMISQGEIYAEKIYHIDESLCSTDICKKILPTALSVGNLFASLKEDWKNPTPELRSRHRVRSTFYKHPNPQCRLDTFIAGSLCTRELDVDFDNQDHRIGACIEEFDPEAARPSCWFSTTKY